MPLNRECGKAEKNTRKVQKVAYRSLSYPYLPTKNVYNQFKVKRHSSFHILELTTKTNISEPSRSVCGKFMGIGFEKAMFTFESKRQYFETHA